MATTTNFDWETPDDTDLVKDGAAAMRTLGSSIDTSMADLLGGTTGQVLAKNSATDMDFVWSDADPLVILDAKGDLITATAADTPARLAVGTNGQNLAADSAEDTGLKWVDPVASGFTLISTQTMSAAASLNVNNCFTASYTNYKILINLTAAGANDYMYMKMRISGTDSSTNYYGWLQRNFSSSATQPTQTSNISNGSSGVEIASSTLNLTSVTEVLSPYTATPTGFASVANIWDTGNSRTLSYTWQGMHSASTSYDGFSLIPNSGTLTGTVYIYGYGV